MNKLYLILILGFISIVGCSSESESTNDSGTLPPKAISKVTSASAEQFEAAEEGLKNINKRQEALQGFSD